METLKQKTIKGIGWSFVDILSGHGITFLVGLILARILSPNEYGILAMITIFIAVSNSIVECGFSNALIRKTEVRSVDYDTVFFFNLVVSVVLYIILYLSSPYIAQFFKEPLLIPVTRVIGLVLIVNALAIIPRTIFVRMIDFKTQTKASLVASVFSGILGISMAVLGYGVWSLVGQQLSRQFCMALFLWIFSRWRPQWVFSKNSFKEMFSFGSKLLLSGIINTIYQNIYALVIGKFYTSDQLGQYTRAQEFSILVPTAITTVVQRVSYPVLSSIKDEPERLINGYRKVIKSTMLISFAAMLGMAAMAKPMILMLIGIKWLPAVYYLQILCLVGMLYPLHAINLNILQVKGRSDLFLKLEIYKKILGIAPILVGIFYGIAPMLWVSVLVSIIAFLLNSYYSASLLSYSTKAQILDVLPSFVVSLIVAIFMWAITFIPIPMFFQLILQFVIGLSLAIVVYERLKMSAYLEMKALLLKAIKRK